MSNFEEYGAYGEYFRKKTYDIVRNSLLMVTLSI